MKTSIYNVDYGVIVGKLHNILSFSQSAWMKPYILSSNDLRTNAKHEFEKDCLNLVNNSVFGTTMEHVKHRIDLRLTTDPKLEVKQFSMLNFKTANYADGFYMIEQI